MKAKHQNITTLLLASIVVTAILAVAVGSCSPDKIETPEPLEVQILSGSHVEASGGIYFLYRADFSSKFPGAVSIEYKNYPSWLTAQADSIFGTPAEGTADTTFDVLALNGTAVDSLRVTVDLKPPLVVYGDTRSGHIIHQQVVDAIRAVMPDAVFHTGDLVNNGTLQGDWDTFNSITADMRAECEFYPALGNHEFQSQLYFDNFELPGNEQWYTVDKEGIHFIILNSCVESGPISEQYQWLENDLQNIGDSIDYIAAVFHHPPYSTGAHGEDEAHLRDTWVQLFNRYGVDIVFNGHDHDYERLYCGNIYYIVTGGGGAPLRDPVRTLECSEKFIKFYNFCRVVNLNGRLIVQVFDHRSSLLDQLEL